MGNVNERPNIASDDIGLTPSMHARGDVAASLRYVLQKHERLVVARLRAAFEMSHGASGELRHAEKMLEAAISEFTACLERAR